MLIKSIRLILVMFSVVLISGCGIYGNPHFLNGDSSGRYMYFPGYQNIFPENNQNINYYAPRNYLNQNIKNSINVSGNSYRDYESVGSKVVFADYGVGDIIKAIDGTIDQIIVEERMRFRIPVCRTVIQHVQAQDYNSFQYINCN